MIAFIFKKYHITILRKISHIYYSTRPLRYTEEWR